MPDPGVIGAAVATKVFTDLFSKLASSMLSGVSSKIYSTITKKGSSFEAHLQATFDRCTKIKTLINRDAPVDLLDQYVNLKFKCNEKIEDDFEVIEAVRKKKRLVISGSGGGGKTIFMKYLWISLFENPKGKIPVFIELRRMNDVSIEKIEVFIYHSIVDTRATLSEQAFTEALRDGLFVLILDGFDEIVAAKRTSLEKQILELAHNYPGLSVVVSGRWDERFNGWQAFSTYHVQPLNKKAVVELISKLRYDNTIKRKFIDRIKKDLYARHQSFLSSPLLATMMLLTFDQFADIPEKIHLFYEQAFDTLFAKHDATKEAFKRSMYTNLSIDVFKRHLAYFCLASYHDEKFEFNETELLIYISKTIKIEGAAPSASEFLQDLIESVCILQKDGLNYSFTHRSFQEFFAAYCMARVTSKHLDEVLWKILRRPTDNVVKMLFDINQELLVGGFVRRHLSEIAKKISVSFKGEFLSEYWQLLGVDLRIARIGREVRVIEDRATQEASFVRLLRKLYPARFELTAKKMNGFHRADKQVAKEAKLFTSKKNRVFYRVWFNSEVSQFQGQLQEDHAVGSHDQVLWAHELGYASYCRVEAEQIVALLAHIDKQQVQKTKAIDELLGIT